MSRSISILKLAATLAGLTLFSGSAVAAATTIEGQSGPAGFTCIHQGTQCTERGGGYWYGCSDELPQGEILTIWASAYCEGFQSS